MSRARVSWTRPTPVRCPFDLRRQDGKPPLWAARLSACPPNGVQVLKSTRKSKLAVLAKRQPAKPSRVGGRAGRAAALAAAVLAVRSGLRHRGRPHAPPAAPANGFKAPSPNAASSGRPRWQGRARPCLQDPRRPVEARSVAGLAPGSQDGKRLAKRGEERILEKQQTQLLVFLSMNHDQTSSLQRSASLHTPLSLFTVS